MTEKKFYVRALGPKTNFTKEFDTYEEAEKYFDNLWGWKLKNRRNDYWTVWMSNKDRTKITRINI